MSTVGFWDPRVRFPSLFITQGDGCLLGQICPSLPRDTERREKDCKKKGNGGVELRGAVIGTFPFLEFFLLTGVQMTQGTVGFLTTLTQSLILFSCGFDFEEGVSPLFVHLCLKFPTGEMYDKGVQPTSVENKTLACMDNLFFPNIMAARYVCVVFHFLFYSPTYICFSPSCCSQCIRMVKKRHEIFKMLAAIIKYMVENTGVEEIESNTGG